MDNWPVDTQMEASLHKAEQSGICDKHCEEEESRDSPTQ